MKYLIKTPNTEATEVDVETFVSLAKKIIEEESCMYSGAGVGTVFGDTLETLIKERHFKLGHTEFTIKLR